jgi:hypothetical protein
MIVKLLKKNLLLMMICLLSGVSLSAQDGGCDCPEEFDPVCVIDAEGNIFPVPNACIAECLELEITDEDCLGDGGGDDFPGTDCDCDEEFDPVCVLTDAESGTICGFPNLCYAECMGYTEDDIVECDEEFACFECIMEGFDPVCVIDSIGEVFSVPNNCYAECLGLEITDEECDDLGGGDDFPSSDCDCEEEEWSGEGICLEIETEGGIEFGWAPSECYAACWYPDVEFVVVECDTVGWPGNDCDCPEEDWSGEGICLEIETEGETEIAWAPSACFATCWYGDTYTIVDCEDDGPGDDCECDESDLEGEGICIEITYADTISGETIVLDGWAPSECYAACWYPDVEFVVVECDTVGWPGNDCDCPEEDWSGEGICLEIETEGETEIAWAPSACFATCWYGDTYTIVDCEDDGPGDDCECDESDLEGEGICIEITYADTISGETIVLDGWAPSECYAACWYPDVEFVVVECDTIIWPGNDCDCPEEDWEGEGICVEVETEYGTESGWVPSECYVGCWYGDLEYTIVDCDYLWEWNDTTSYEIDSCLILLEDGDFLTLQSFLLALAESCDLELPECILDAPIFDTDEEFILYLEENCPDVLGGLFSAEGEEGMSLFDRYSSGGGLISSTDEALYDAVSLNILGNPVTEILRYQIVAEQATLAQVSITDMSGKTVKAQQLQLSAGTTTLELDMQHTSPSLYFLSVQTESGITNLKFFKE